MNEKLRDYKERHVRWQSVALTQLGYTNNIFLTLGIGFLAFAFEKDFLATLSFSKGSVFNLKMSFYVVTILCILISIGYGVVTSITRLYDFKLTRHIALTRQRFYENCKNEPKTLPVSDFPRPRFNQRFKVLCHILFKSIDFIDRKEVTNLLINKQSEERFNELREKASILGILTWKLMKFQMLFFVISMILYSISLFL